MILQADNITKQYSDFTLRCSVVLEEGRITGIIGQNGAGKSTFFKAILGLIHTNSGSIHIFGKPVSKLTKEDRERIGVVFADSGFSGYLTVRDAIAVMKGSYHNFKKADFISQCKHFSIPLDKKIKDFSTGMKAKLKVLISMSYGADFLILDEPTLGLDVVARKELLDMIRDYMEQDGRSILISSHIASDLENLCDDLYLIHDGEIQLHEDTDVLLDEYGILKVNMEQYEKLDKTYLLSTKKETFGYECLTNRKHFYMENYPDIIIEKSHIDNILIQTIQGMKNDDSLNYTTYDSNHSADQNHMVLNSKKEVR